MGNGTFEEYVLNIVANNPQKTGETFIKSNDIKTILSEADYVFGVTVIGEMDIDHAEDRNPCECRLTKVYKGSEIPESYSTGERPITVIFPGGTGAPGESYIVAVNGILSALTMTSKYNSFYDVSMEEEIIAILAGNA